MRYYEVKNPIKEENIDFNYVEAIQNIICANIPSSPETFLRMADLYQKTLSLKPGDFLEIEDQDYTSLILKFNYWLSQLNGNAIKFPQIVEFVKNFKDLPSLKKTLTR